VDERMAAASICRCIERTNLDASRHCQACSHLVRSSSLGDGRSGTKLMLVSLLEERGSEIKGKNAKYKGEKKKKKKLEPNPPYYNSHTHTPPPSLHDSSNNRNRMRHALSTFPTTHLGLVPFNRRSRYNDHISSSITTTTRGSFSEGKRGTRSWRRPESVDKMISITIIERR